MRRRPVLLFALAFATPAAAQELGARTTSPEAMMRQMNNGSPEDEMQRMIAEADAHPLGTPQNPIRVAGPEGERAYLAHLRCSDGTTIRVGGRREAGVGAYGSVVAAYDVACGAATGRLVFDMYQAENVETRAPAGYSLTP
ncbi:MAG TPA: hypothetical protein VIT38_04090 [Allosphingosinicella sp.]